MASDHKLDNLSSFQPPDESYVYIAVKGSLHSGDCAVFGLNTEECRAISQRFPESQELLNGLMLKGHPLSVVNSLAELGYSVVASTGEAEITWTMKREI